MDRHSRLGARLDRTDRSRKVTSRAPTARPAVKTYGRSDSHQPLYVGVAHPY